MVDETDKPEKTAPESEAGGPQPSAPVTAPAEDSDPRAESAPSSPTGSEGPPAPVDTSPPKPNPAAEFFRWTILGIYRWLVPIRKAVDEDDGTLKLVYTSFPRSFYLYLIWLPGLVALALGPFIDDTTLVWILLISGGIFYFTVAEAFQLTEFLLWITLIILAVVLYNFGVIDFGWLRAGVGKLKDLSLAFDRETVAVITGGTFMYWTFMYIFSVTWRRRELSSNRRAMLRPPRGKKILPVVGRIVDNQLVDVLELIFGGAYDIVITETNGRELDRDRNCVGLFLYLNFFGDLVGRIATRSAPEAHVAAVAATDAGQEEV